MSKRGVIPLPLILVAGLVLIMLGVPFVQEGSITGFATANASSNFTAPPGENITVGLNTTIGNVTVNSTNITIAVNSTDSVEANTTNITVNTTTANAINTSVSTNATKSVNQTGKGGGTLGAQGNGGEGEFGAAACIGGDCDCGTTIPSAQHLTLTDDISNCAVSSALTINASDVYLDCAGHEISSDESDRNQGVYVYPDSGDVDNVTIANCVFKDWNYTTSYLFGNGIYLASGSTDNTNYVLSNVLIINNTFEDVSNAVVMLVTTSGVGTGSATMEYVNITRNNVSSARNFSIITYVSVGPTNSGSATLRYVYAWMNNLVNFTNETIIDLSGGGTPSISNAYDCAYECDDTLCNTFGNYYANGEPRHFTCTTSTGNYSFLPELSFPITSLPLLCNATLFGDVTMTGHLQNRSGEYICPEAGLVINNSGVDLDCAGYNITGNMSAELNGILVKEGNGSVANCNISGFTYGINVSNNANWTVISNNVFWNVSRGLSMSTPNNGSRVYLNVFNASGYDLFLTDPGNPVAINVSRNSFYATGVSGASAAVFCENNLGNFFAEGLTVPSDDCGLLNITDPANDIYLPADTTTLTLKQHDAAETVFYEVRWKTNVNPYNLAFSTDRISTQNGTSASIAWDTSALPGDQYTINITPYANSSMFGVIKEARSFQRTEDINTSDFDADGFDDVALGGTDCNDLDNSTNPSATEQCGTTNDRRTDYNCNNKPGWGDADCSPPDFDPGTFNYVNENSRNGTTDWNALNSIQTATVSYLTLNNSYGRVVFSGNIDLDGLNLTYVDISDGSIDVDSVNMQTLNRSAELIFYKTFENKTANPVALRNGQVCGSYCTDPVVTNGKVTFNVTSFTNYSASTNSQLTIYDEGDPLGGNKTLEKLHQIRFFANYSKITDDTPINNRTVEAASVDHRGRCNISLRFENGTTIFADQKMGYSEFYGRYDYTANPFNFTTAGTYTYNITCTAENFATLFGEDTLSVTIDTTSPIAPILYPQIVLHPTNTTTDNHTMVCGYFNESYINISGSVLQGIYTYDFGGFTNYSEQDSYYGGAGITTTFNSLAGQNVTFVNWSAEVETLFNSFAYIEYLNHDRTCFIRYNISRVNRTGNELRIELTEALQDDVPIGTRISLFDSSRPAGWFNQSVSLFTGANKIAIWGDDLSGNSGPASEDSINSPYAAVVPPKPILWPLTSVVNGNFSVLGIVNRLVLSTTNISLVVLNNSNYSVQYHNSSVFTLTTTVANATVVQPASENDDFIYINGSDEVFFKNTSRFIGFANHNRTHWYHYSISNYTNPLPGEDLRIYLSPNLTSAVPNLTTVFLYNNSVPQGWFNATLDEANMWANKTHEFYVVATDANGESPKSDTYFIFYDIDDPEFMPGSTIGDYDPFKFYYTMPVNKTYRLTDNYAINTTNHYITWTNTTNTTWYLPTEIWSQYNDEEGIRTYLAGKGHDLSGAIISPSMISCTGLVTNVSCTVQFNHADGTYNVTIYAEDRAGNNRTVYLNGSNNVTVLTGGIQVVNITDHGDITNWPYINVSWNFSGDVSKLNGSQFAVGTAAYPDSAYDDMLAWTNNTGLRSYVLVNKSYMSFMTSTVYYVTVRSISIAGDFGTPNSTNGILFIDNTPPQCAGGGNCVLDDGLFTNDNQQLHMVFNFTDNESDIVMYEYAVGTACYPNSGYDAAVSRTYTTSTDFIKSGLSLTDGDNYSISTRARNGNLAENFNGTWSQFKCSDGITVDVSAPYSGAISYKDGFKTEQSLLINYTSGYDDISGLNNTQLLVATAPLGSGLDNTCGSFSAYAISRSLPTIPGNTTGGFIYNMTNGTCYSFNLLVHDRAGNSQQFGNANYSSVVRVDTTPPTDIASVTDDGFVTYVPGQLHASWTISTDAETGIDHYAVRITGKQWDDTSCNATNCTQVYAGNVTNNEIVANSINSTHNWKYFFEVTAWNSFNLTSAPAYSDGIIYVDIIPPSAANITSVNNDTTNSYETNSTNITINFTGEADMDCILTETDIDFIESAQHCSEVGVSTGSYTCNNETVGRITNTGETSSDGQGYFTWHLTCKDQYGNYQDSGQNKDFTFLVDYPDPPSVNEIIIYSDTESLSLTENVAQIKTAYSEVDNRSSTFYLLATDVNETEGTATIQVNQSYYNDTDVDSLIKYVNGSDRLSFKVNSISGSTVGLVIYPEEIFIGDMGNPVRCVAEVTDDDGQTDIDSVNMTISIEGSIANISSSLSNSGHLYEYSLTNISSATRDKNLTCAVTAKDGESVVSGSNSTGILNTKPTATSITYPLGITISSNATFQWLASSDGDGDHLTYTLEIDNESMGDFDTTELTTPSFDSGIVLNRSGLQQYPDIYGDVIVYQDTRTGVSDIYEYNLTSGVETQITATGSSQEYFPRISDKYILFKEGATSLKVYNRNTGVISSIATVNAALSDREFDVWDDIVVYSYDSGTAEMIVYNITSASQVYSEGIASIGPVAIYGHLVFFADQPTGRVYDMISGKSREVVPSGLSLNYTDVFGEYLAYADTSNRIGVRNVSDPDTAMLVLTDVTRPSLYEGKLAYMNINTKNVTIRSLPGAVSVNYSGARPVMYKNYLVVENGTGAEDIAYRLETTPAPALFASHGLLTSYTVDTSLSVDYPDITIYKYRIKVCDSTYSNNSCAYSATQSFFLDNEAPTVAVINPVEDMITGGTVTLLTTVTDNLDPQSSLNGTVNYTVAFQNGTVFKNTTYLFPTGFDDSIDFTGLSGNNTLNMTLTVRASDTQGNTRVAIINFSVNPQNPDLNFSNFESSERAINDSLNDTFTALNVMNSSFKVLGPSPANTVRYSAANTNDTMTEHEYDVLLSIAAWSDGTYTMVFTGQSYVNPNYQENRTFYVDREAPVLIYNTTVENKTAYYANDTVYYEVRYNDTTLQRINITFRSWDSGIVTYTRDYNYSAGTSYATFNTYSSDVLLKHFINSTYCWNSTALDYLNRTASSRNCFFVYSNAPYLTANISLLQFAEDYNSSSTNPASYRNLTAKFTDPDVSAGIDNLTFECNTSSADNLTCKVDNNTGLFDLVPDPNFYGVQYVKFRAKDYYGNYSGWSSDVEVIVTSVNDAPEIGVIPTIDVSEDNGTFVFNLSGYESDADNYDMLDNLTWSITDRGNTSLINISVNNTDNYTKILVINTVANISGWTNITLKLSDSQGASDTRQVLINITPVNDAPAGQAIIVPGVGDFRSGQITVQWSSASDVEGNTINYTLEYSTDGGTTFTLINSTIAPNTTLVWNSSSISLANVTLRLNASDGENHTNYTMSGNFTVDNIAPGFGSVYPVNNQVIATNQTLVNITTDELANCTITLNGSTTTGTVNSTINTTVHWGNTSNISASLQEDNYTLKFTCVDRAGNSNSTTSTFKKRDNDITFEGYTVSPVIAYVNQSVNITLRFAIIGVVNVLDVDIINATGGVEQSFDINDFTPKSNSTSEISTNITGYAQLGNHSINITNVDCAVCGTSWSLYSISGAFTVYEEANQSINLV